MKNNKVLPAKAGIIHILPLVLVGLVIMGLIGFWLYQTFFSVEVPENWPSEASKEEMEYQEETRDWKTYATDIFKVKHPRYNPVEVFTPPREGSGIFIVSKQINFDADNLKLCDVDDNLPCMLEGKSWGQEKDVVSTKLDSAEAISFYIVTPTENSGTNVLHVVQTIDKPIVEIAMAVDGSGLEEYFNQILSTFEFNEK